MKRIVIVLLWLVPLYVNAQKETSIVFNNKDSWNELIEQAKLSNKLIFIDVFATWCVPCKKMEKEVFTNPKVAAFVNENFISVRVQMDSTKNDDLHVKNWQRIAQKWKSYITGFPCFLFFSPDGQYGGRLLGEHPADIFISRLQQVIDTSNNYLSQVEKYKKGKLSKDQLRTLAISAERNKDTIDEKLALDYKTKYLSQGAIDSMFNRGLDEFLLIFYYKVFTAKDELIRFMYKNPALSDSLLHRSPGYSAMLSSSLIAKDYVYNAILRDGVPIKTDPQWKKIHADIARDFDKASADKFVLDGKIFWEHQHNRYHNATKLEFEKIDKYGMDKSGIGRAGFNNLIFNVVFKYVDDMVLLRKAASLMRYVNEMEDYKSASYMDTYATILYKAGERQKAIELEAKALELAKAEKGQRQVSGFAKTVDRMKNNEKIWE